MEYMESKMQEQIESGISERERCYNEIAELEHLRDALAAKVVEVTAERDALASQVVALKSASKKVMFKGGIVASICYNIGQHHQDSEQILQAVREYDAEVRNFHDVSALNGGAK